MGFEDLFSGLGNLFGGGDSGQTQQTQPSGVGQPAGGDLLSSILLGVGAPLITKLMGATQDKQINKGMGNLQTESNTATNAGKALIDRATAGKLTDPQQAQVDAMKKEQNARNAQYLASLGIPVSTANTEMQNQVDANAVKMANDLINQSFDQGIKAFGLVGPASQALITNAMKQRTDMANTISDVAKQVGMVMNQPGRTQQPTAQEAISSGAQNWGEGDYDPYANLMPDYT